VSPSPASTLTVAIALALVGGCAVAPSPAPSLAPSIAPSASTAASPAASPAESSFAASPSPSSAAGAPLLVAWERRGDQAHLIIVDNGTVDRRPLPALPNGPVAGGVGGTLAFLSGPFEQPVLWTSRGSLDDPEWDAQPLVPPGPRDAPFMWLCLSPGSPPRVAVQSDDNLLYVVDDGGRPQPLPLGLLMLRPGGCAWSDPGHMLVPADAPQPTFHIGFAMFDVDAATSRLVPGTGGEAPTVSDVSLAYVAHDQAGRQVVWIGAIPSAEGPLPAPYFHVTPQAPDAGDLDLFQPVLSADGRRLAVIELARPSAPLRVLVYDLFPTPTLVSELDVQGASDAGPAWVANPPAG
jgi:hypothetical protein